MNELQDAINDIQNVYRDDIRLMPDSLGEVVAAARRVTNGTVKAAIQLGDSDGNLRWGVTIIVDGPGDYILLPPGDTK